MNPTIVITGASRGIGFSIAEMFASKGFNLAICSRNETQIQKAAETIAANTGVSVLAKPVDLTNVEDILAFASSIQALESPVEALINNAGSYVPGMIATEPAENLELMLSTNLMSAYHMSRAIIPLMDKAAKPTIVNISSIAGLNAYPNGGAYSISKFAMTGLSKGLREELKEKRIRVTSVYPGAVLTSSWEDTSLPEDRFISSEDIAKCIYSVYDLSARTVVEDIIIRPQLGDL